MPEKILKTLSSGGIACDALGAALSYAGEDAEKLASVRAHLIEGIRKKIADTSVFMKSVGPHALDRYAQFKQGLEEKLRAIEAGESVTADALRAIMGCGSDKAA